MSRERRGSPERLSHLIDPALRGLGVRGHVRDEQLRASLADIVGPALAPMCRAEHLSRGVLLIATSNSALAHQLQMDADRLITMLNEMVGEPVVQRLRFTTL